MFRKAVLRLFFQAALAVVFAATSAACIWDGDTLATERARFPGVDVIIAGAFPRHSREFHEWRVRQRQKDIASADSLPSHFDDLAVSQHKLGDHKAAIATMMQKEKLIPGMYETFSNLGTFYIYTGELKLALFWIEKALALNPNAHFGRERYQKWLVEWLMSKALPQENNEPYADLRRFSKGSTGFASFLVFKETGIKPGASESAFTEKQRASAVKGVTGMMLFADFDNPVLQEALGDILLAGSVDGNAAHMASFCYVHASMKAVDPAEKERLKLKAGASGMFSRGFEIGKVEAQVASALEKGQAYNEKVRADEIRWIAEGADVAREFQDRYLPPSKGH